MCSIAHQGFRDVNHCGFERGQDPPLAPVMRNRLFLGAPAAARHCRLRWAEAAWAVPRRRGGVGGMAAQIVEADGESRQSHSAPTGQLPAVRRDWLLSVTRKLPGPFRLLGRQRTEMAKTKAYSPQQLLSGTFSHFFRWHMGGLWAI